MRHTNTFRKFSMTSTHRRSMFRNMATSLFRAGHFETTYPRAKDLQRVVEKLITTARTDSLASRKQIYSYLKCEKVVQKLFTEIAPKFKDRKGGYTRVLKTRTRHGDAAQMAFIQLLSNEEKVATGASA